MSVFRFRVVGAVFGGGLLSLVLLTAALGSPDPTASGAGGGLKAGSVPAAYVDLVTAAGTVCPAFPAPVIAAQIEVESGWDPAAVSPAGAEGISQFMPATWASWGGDSDGNGTSSPFDPGDAIPAQARFDCALAAQMGAAISSGQVSGISVTDAALAAYNAGPAAVLAAGGIPRNGQTPAYVAHIDALAAAYAAPAAPVRSSGFGAGMVAAAEAELGLPYVWGGGDTAGATTGLAGTGAAGFDCSGLVLYAAYTASGGTVVLPHDSNVQGRVGVQVALGLGSTIDLGLLEPGDVVAFNLDGGDHYSHIGIYVGGGMLLHASHPGPGGGVKLESLSESYWAPYLWSVRRYGSTGTGSGSGSGSAPSGVAMPTGDLPGFTQVMADDFTATTPDPRWWGSPYDGRPHGTRDSWWLPSHLSVAGGQLDLATARDRAAPGDAWTPAGLSTGDHLAQIYGRYEVRMRADPAAGIDVVALLWPAHGHRWPPEIDFAENSGDRAELTATLHTAPGNQMTHRRITLDMTGWHTYGLTWTPARLVFTVDGTQWASITGAGVPSIPMELDVQTENMCGLGPCAGPATPATTHADIDWAVAYRWNGTP